MEQQNISFNKGIHRSPSMGDAGEMSELINLIPKGGELKPLLPPEAINVNTRWTFGEGGASATVDMDLLYIHRAGGEDNYIMYQHYDDPEDNTQQIEKLGYKRGSTDTLNELDMSDLYVVDSTTFDYNVTSVGNTLVVSGSKFGYYLWKGNGYISLGHEIPQVRLNLLLDREVKTYTINDAAISLASPTDISDEIIDYSNFVGRRTIPKDTTITPYSVLDYATYGFNIGTIPINTALLIKYDHNQHGLLWRLMGKKVVNGVVGNSSEISSRGVGSGHNHQAVFGVISSEYEYRDCYLVLYNNNSGLYRFGEDTSYTLLMSESGIQKYSIADDTSYDNLIALSEGARVAAHNQGAFIYPFFVRYGLRMYDGNVVNISEPCLLVPDSGATPRMFFTESGGSPTFEQAAVWYIKSCLYYRLDNAARGTLESIKSVWSDIIDSIVFYVSQPIYTIDTSVTYKNSNKYSLLTEFTQFEFSNDPNANTNTTEGEPDKYWSGLGLSYTVASPSAIASGALTGQFSDSDDYIYFPQASVYTIAAGYANSNGWKYSLTAPPVKADRLYGGYTETSSFFKVSEIKVNSIDTDEINQASGTTFGTTSRVKIDENVLETLTNQEAMPTTTTARGVVAAKTFSYNSRLLAYSSNRVALDSTTLDIAYQQCAPILTDYMYNPTGAYIYIEDADSSGWMELDWTLPYTTLYWFFVPYRHAKRLVFHDNNGLMYHDVTLTPHPYLDGVYWFSNFIEPDVVSEPSIPTPITQWIKEEDSSLYVSDSGNPFVFHTDKTISLTGEILAISTAAKALSQGQFGQFPLYAFCTDGIWALQVSDTGTISARQPISRDVITKGIEPCQLDQAVAYITAQGLKIIEGSNTHLVSEPLTGEWARLDENGNFDMSFFNARAYLQNTKAIVYDSANQLIRIFPTPEGVQYSITCYVYSLESKEWASQYLNSNVILKNVVPGYPYSTLRFYSSSSLNNSTLCQFNENIDNSTLQIAAVMTRPIAFGDPFGMKLLWDLRVSAVQYTGGQYLVLPYVSNDRVTWKELSSLKKHAYKWYRFRLAASVYPSDSIAGMSCQYENRRTNKLR